MGLSCKLVKAARGLFAHAFASGFIIPMIRLSLRPSGVGRAPIMDIYFLLFRGTEGQHRVLLALAASQVILDQNNQYASP